MPEKDEKDEKKIGKAAGVCGHQNKHYRPSEGLGDVKMTCTQPKGHEPVAVRREVLGQDKKLHETSTMEVIHSAPYEYFKEGIKKEGVAYWSDEAGTPSPHKK